MSTRAMPRRRRVAGEKNHNVYERPDGLFEVGYRDSAGKQRWRVPDFPAAFKTITEARRARDSVLGRKASGETVKPSPKLAFGAVADRWLAEQVVELRPRTRERYVGSVKNHLRPRWDRRRMDAIDVSDAAKLVRELRAEGLAEWTISGILRVAGRIFRFARRYCGWRGEDPFTLLEAGERPRISATPERRIYVGDELAQTLAVSWEPWTTLFRLADVVAGRESELLGLWWEDLDLRDLDAATIRFGFQVDRQGGVRVPLKTDESKAVLPLPRAAALMLLEHRARTVAPTGANSFVFATRTGKPLGQRNALRALYKAQQRARTPEGVPTFPALFEHDERGHLLVDDKGDYVPTRAHRRDLPPLPDFHALRHTAAMDCEDAEEARDLLRHRNSNVTRAVYRAHFDDRRREALRSRMEARMEATNRNEAQPDGGLQAAEVFDLQEARSVAQ